MEQRTPEQRFWNKVEKRGPDECWEWKAAFCSGGYGHLRVSKRLVSAHKFSYELHFGPLKGLFCLHACDNPKCVKPKHLFAGTQTQNIHDMMRKGRASIEEKNYQAKLSVEKVKAAKLYRLEGWSYARIAKRFNVSQHVIWNALTGKTWKSVA